ncbi:MAG: mevalonate kinase family protein [Candidatus Hodarchaeales archaeon]|jgi:galactokinase
MTLTVIAPGRVVLFGEHQDYLGLPVIPAAIDLHISVTGKIDNSSKFRVNLPDLGSIEEFSTSDLTNLPERAYLRSCVKILQKEEIVPATCGVSATITSEIPIKAGLSSSSALNVVWLKFLAEVFDHKLDPAKLTELAYKAEVLEFNEPGGMMDQMIISHGSCGYCTFEPVPKYTQILKEFPGLVIGDSNEKKDTLNTLSKVRQGVNTGLESIEKTHVKDVELSELEEFKNIDPFAKSCLTAAVKNYGYTKSAYQEFRNYKEKFSHDMIGYLMNDHHNVLRDYLDISTPKIEKMILAANKAGALGCKITGSGNGGCMIAFCPGKEKEVVDAIQNEGGIAYHTRVVPGANRF